MFPGPDEGTTVGSFAHMNFISRTRMSLDLIGGDGRGLYRISKTNPNSAVPTHQEGDEQWTAPALTDYTPYAPPAGQEKAPGSSMLVPSGSTTARVFFAILLLCCCGAAAAVAAYKSGALTKREVDMVLVSDEGTGLKLASDANNMGTSDSV